MSEFKFNPDEWITKKAGRGGYHHNTTPSIKLSWRAKDIDKITWSTNRFLMNSAALREFGFAENEKPLRLSFSYRDDKTIQLALNAPSHIDHWIPQKSKKQEVIINSSQLVHETLEHLGKKEFATKNATIEFGFEIVYNEKGIIVLELKLNKIYESTRR